MTPKEKAEELIKKFRFESLASHSDSIKCAIVTVDEVIKVLDGFNYTPTQEYWQQVKQELTTP